MHPRVTLNYEKLVYDHRFLLHDSTRTLLNRVWGGGYTEMKRGPDSAADNSINYTQFAVLMFLLSPLSSLTLT